MIRSSVVLDRFIGPLIEVIGRFQSTDRNKVTHFVASNDLSEPSSSSSQPTRARRCLADVYRRTILQDVTELEYSCHRSIDRERHRLLLEISLSGFQCFHSRMALPDPYSLYFPGLACSQLWLAVTVGRNHHSSLETLSRLVLIIQNRQ